MGEQNIKLTTFPQALIKQYPNRTRVFFFNTVMCLPAHAFEVFFSSYKLRKGEKKIVIHFYHYISHFLQLY